MAIVKEMVIRAKNLSKYLTCKGVLLVVSTSELEPECLRLTPSLPLASSMILGLLLNFLISFLVYKIV